MIRSRGTSTAGSLLQIALISIFSMPTACSLLTIQRAADKDPSPKASADLGALSNTRVNQCQRLGLQWINGVQIKASHLMRGHDKVVVGYTEVDSIPSKLGNSSIYRFEKKVFRNTNISPAFMKAKGSLEMFKPNQNRSSFYIYSPRAKRPVKRRA